MEAITAVLDSLVPSVRLTCFSEILADTATVQQELKMEGNHILTFLTDGYPVVSDTKKEIADTLDALSRLKMDKALFVGYKSYFNKGLMQKMAEVTNGQVLYSDDIDQVVEVWGEHASAGGFTKVDAPGFAVINGRAVPIIDKAPLAVSEYYVEDDLASDAPQMAYYAFAGYALSQGNPDLATHIMSEVGDIYFVNRLWSAFTNNDYIQIQGMLTEATKFPSLRFKQGRVQGYTPKEDGPNVYQLLQILAEDRKGQFIPPKDYSRTTAKREYTEFKFIDIPDQVYPLSDIVVSSDRANISLRINITGHVPIGDNPLGLENPFLCVRFKTYTLVKDGEPNMAEISVITSRSTHRKLKGLGYDLGEWKSNTPYAINLKNIPLINREMSYLSAGKLESTLNSTFDYLAAQKALKYLLDQRVGKLKLDSPYTPEQQEFLRDANVVNGVYTPPSNAALSGDKYIAYQVKWNIPTLPSVKEVKDKTLQSATKRQTPLVKALLAYTYYSDAELANELRRVKDELLQLRYTLAVAAAAAITANRPIPAHLGEIKSIEVPL